MASRAVFRNHPECGFGSVPQVRAETQAMGQGALYGEMRGSDEVDADAVKERVRLLIITGNNGFRYGNLQDIYRGGFQSDGYQAKLSDVPRMAHRICQPEALESNKGRFGAQPPS